MHRQSYPRFLQSEIFHAVLQTTYAFNPNSPKPILSGINAVNNARPPVSTSKSPTQQQQIELKKPSQGTVPDTTPPPPTQRTQQEQATQQHKLTILATSRAKTTTNVFSATAGGETAPNKQKIDRQRSLPTKSHHRDLQNIKRESKLEARKSSHN